MGFVAKTSLNIISRVADDIGREADKRTMQAATHVRRALVASARATFTRRSGDLARGFGTRRTAPGHVLVGATAPAYHAHLLEFGTKERTVKNSFGRKGVQAKAGRVKARPFVEPTFEREAAKVEEILSGVWVK